MYTLEAVFQSTWSNLRECLGFICNGMFQPTIVCYLLFVTLRRSDIYVHRLSGFHARGFLQSETCMNQGECWTWNAFVFIIYYLQVFYSALSFILNFITLYFFLSFVGFFEILTTSKRIVLKLYDVNTYLLTATYGGGGHQQLSGSIPGFNHGYGYLLTTMNCSSRFGAVFIRVLGTELSCHILH